jgi:hypothetical protein
VSWGVTVSDMFKQPLKRLIQDTRDLKPD